MAAKKQSYLLPMEELRQDVESMRRGSASNSAVEKILKRIDTIYLNKEINYVAVRGTTDVNIIDGGFNAWFAFVCLCLHEKHGWSFHNTIVEATTQGGRWKPLYDRGLTIHQAITKMTKDVTKE